MKKRTTYSEEFVEEAILSIEKSDTTTADLAREPGVKRNQLFTKSHAVSSGHFSAIEFTGLEVAALEWRNSCMARACA